MNEIQTNNFDYSVLSNEEKLSTLENEKRLDEVFERYQPEVGEILYDQQQVLANHTDGTFQMWYESKGFNRGQVYRYINKHKYVLTNCEDPQKLDIFNNAPKSLQNEMSKPSADPEINQKVFDGDVKTHKDYKQMEREKHEAKARAKEYERQLEYAHKENDILQSKLDDAENKEPEVIEKYTEPEDYQDIKDSLERMEEMLKGKEESNQKYLQEIADMRAKRSDMDKKSKEYDRLNQAINEMNGRLDKGQKRIAAQKEVYDLVRNANRLIEEVAPLSYLVNTEEILDNEYATKPIKKLIKNLNEITKRLNESINQTEIVEVN